MKHQPTHVERFTLPGTARGRELAEALVATLRSCERTATLSEEIIECKAEGLIFRVFVVEAGSRPTEGMIANEMKRLNAIANLNRKVKP